MSEPISFTLKELIDLIGDRHFLSIGEVAQKRWEAERARERLSIRSPWEDVDLSDKAILKTNSLLRERLFELGKAVYSIYRIQMGNTVPEVDTGLLNDPDITKQRGG